MDLKTYKRCQKALKCVEYYLFNSYGQYVLYFNCFIKKKAMKFKKNLSKNSFWPYSQFCNIFQISLKVVKSIFFIEKMLFIVSEILVEYKITTQIWERRFYYESVKFTKMIAYYGVLRHCESFVNINDVICW